MRSGDLRYRIELQSSVGTTDSFGQSIPAWSTYATIWAGPEALNGRELEKAKQIVAEVSHIVPIRYRADVLPKHRIKWGSRYFGIGAVIPDKRNREKLTLYCTEEV